MTFIQYLYSELRFMTYKKQLGEKKLIICKPINIITITFNFTPWKYILYQILRVSPVEL